MTGATGCGGNQRGGEPRAAAATAATVDHTPPAAPSIASTSHPDADTAYVAATLEAWWTAPTDASGIAGFGVVIDDAPTTEPDAVTQTEQTIKAPEQPSGTHYLHVRAQDRAGNWSATSHFRFVVAGNVDQVELVEPVEAPATNGHVRLVAQAPGSAGVRFEFRRFDELPWSTVPNARLTTEAGAAAALPITPGTGGVTDALIWDTLATAETDPGVGENQLQYQDGPIVVRAVDAATGKASEVRLVTLDRTPPELNVKSNRGDEPLLVGDTVRFRWKPAEAVAGYNIVTDDERDTDIPAEITSPASTSSATITRSSAGNRYIHLRAVDAVGNWTPTYSLEGRFVDGLVTGPPPGLYLTGTEPVVKLTQTLAGSGTGYVCVKYRRPGSADWMLIPEADVTQHGKPIGAWPVAIPKGSKQTLDWQHWQTAPEIRNNPGGIEVRTYTGTATTACDRDAATELATRDVFYEPPPG